MVQRVRTLFRCTFSFVQVVWSLFDVPGPPGTNNIVKFVDLQKRSNNNDFNGKTQTLSRLLNIDEVSDSIRSYEPIESKKKEEGRKKEEKEKKKEGGEKRPQQYSLFSNYYSEPDVFRTSVRRS